MNSNHLTDSPLTLPDALKAPAADGAIDGALLRRGWSALREGTHEVGERARQVSASGVHYIRDEPMKAVLIAAAAGAVLAGLLALLTRTNRRG